MDELIQLVTKTYGLVGILILAPLGAVYLLWRENQKLHKDATEKEKATALTVEMASNRVIAAQEQRVKDAQEVASRLIAMSSEQGALIRENNLALGEISKLLDEARTRALIGKR